MKHEALKVAVKGKRFSRSVKIDYMRKIYIGPIKMRLKYQK